LTQDDEGTLWGLVHAATQNISSLSRHPEQPPSGGSDGGRDCGLGPQKHYEWSLPGNHSDLSLRTDGKNYSPVTAAFDVDANCDPSLRKEATCGGSPNCELLVVPLGTDGERVQEDDLFPRSLNDLSGLSPDFLSLSQFDSTGRFLARPPPVINNNNNVEHVLPSNHSPSRTTLRNDPDPTLSPELHATSSQSATELGSSPSPSSSPTMRAAQRRAAVAARASASLGAASATDSYTREDQENIVKEMGC